MEEYQVYQDIKERTNGEIYIGVVGAGKNRKINIHKKIYEPDGYS